MGGCVGGGAMCVGVVVVVCVGQLRAEWSPVFYTSGGMKDSPLMAPGKMITSSQAFLTLNHTSKCECRMACWTAAWCVAVAAVPVGEAVECHLSKDGPLVQDLTNNNDATYYFWKASVPHLFYGVKKRDGLLYVVLEEKVKFMDARALCQRLPGHRLAITKFKKQYLSLMNQAKRLNKQLWVDLYAKGKNEVRIWGDGTYFDDTETASEATTKDGHREEKGYLTKGDILHDENINKEHHPYCQASPQGLNFPETRWG